MRRLEFLVAKDPIRDKTGDMVMLSLLMSLARVSNSVTFVGLGAHPGHVEGGVILPKPEARGVDLLRRAMRSRRSLLHERFDIPEMSEAVRRSTADAIVADHSYLAEPFFAAQRDLPLYVSTVVSETLVWRATHGIVGRLQAGAIRRDELRAARAATAVATYDAEEAADYRASGVGRATWLEVTLPPRDDLPHATFRCRGWRSSVIANGHRMPRVCECSWVCGHASPRGFPVPSCGSLGGRPRSFRCPMESVTWVSCPIWMRRSPVAAASSLRSAPAGASG